MVQTIDSVQRDQSGTSSRAALLDCLHCYSAVPPGRQSRFCCPGCEIVYETINSLGLNDYYSMRAQIGARAQRPVSEPNKNFAYYDEPLFVDRFAPFASGKTSVRQITFYLEGIHCAACIWILEKLSLLNSGILSAQVEFGRGVLKIEYVPAATPLSNVASLISSLGYTPSPIVKGGESEIRKKSNRIMLTRIGVAALCTMNVMMMALSIYQGQLSGIEPSYQQLFSWTSLFLTLPIMLFCALPFYRTAIGGLKTGVLHIDLPIVVAILAGFALSVWNTIAGSGIVYYDSICALILLLLTGRWVQHRSIERVLDSSNLLYALSPRSARLADTHKERFVESLVVGERVVVRGTETIPVDGQIVSGHGNLTNTLLTGESTPVPIANGMWVFAGSRLVDGEAVITVTAAGRASRLGRLMVTLEHAAHVRAPLELFLNRVSRGFVAAVLVLAAATFWWWSSVGSLTQAFEYSVALLVVSCPCVLAVATPLTFSLAVAQAARRGILIKNADSIERLTKVRRLLIDKTGTLTCGEMAIVAMAFKDKDGQWQDLLSPVEGLRNHLVSELVAIAASLERESFHPIGAAIRKLAPSHGALPFIEPRIIIGKGIEAKIDGQLWSIGSAKLVVPAYLNTSKMRTIRSSGADLNASEVFLCRGGSPVLVFFCGDKLRPESASVIETLGSRYKLDIQMVSGDSQLIVNQIAGRLNIAQTSARGDLSPEDKLTITKASEATVPTAFVGDGANDAPSFTACSVGVGVHGGAELCLSVADVYLSAPGLDPLLALFDGAHRTLSTIKVGLWMSAFYNVVGGGAAILGYIGPLQAAILMPLSSLSTIGVALLTRKFK